jgi:hypothetical protein
MTETKKERKKDILTPELRKKLARFRKFNEENPQVYEMIVQFTLEMWRAGRRRYSIRVVVERVRWETDIKTTDASFKINNNFFPLYSRKVMRDYPELKEGDGFFELRALKG